MFSRYWLAVVVAGFAMQSAATAQQLDGAVAKDFAEYQRASPQKAFVLRPDGKASHWQGGLSEADPGSAVTKALARCADRSKQSCRIYAVNNVLINTPDWQSAAPAPLPQIGRLRAQPWWMNKGPQAATGLIVWSHGYLPGTDSTNSAPQPHVGYFLAAGYDLYRFDRLWIRDQAGDATAFAEAVRQAKEMGYRRVVLAGQSNGAWQSLAAVAKGAPADGVIAMAPALNDSLTKVRDLSILKSDWQQLVSSIKPGPRIVIANFAGDDKDVGGRMGDAKAAFGVSGVSAVLLAEPSGFTGHGAANDFKFSRSYADCIQAFIESGIKRPPCL
jgi:dienelactone hydrolase